MGDYWERVVVHGMASRRSYDELMQDKYGTTKPADKNVKDDLQAVADEALQPLKNPLSNVPSLSPSSSKVPPGETIEDAQLLTNTETVAKRALKPDDSRSNDPPIVPTTHSLEIDVTHKKEKASCEPDNPVDLGPRGDLQATVQAAPLRNKGDFKSCSNTCANACSGAGAFALGSGIAGGIFFSIVEESSLLTACIGGAIGGAYFAGIALVARVADKVFKNMGWEHFQNSRLLVSHAVAGIFVTAPLVILTGMPLFVGAVATTAALGVNLLVNDWINT